MRLWPSHRDGAWGVAWGGGNVTRGSHMRHSRRHLRHTPNRQQSRPPRLTTTRGSAAAQVSHCNEWKQGKCSHAIIQGVSTLCRLVKCKHPTRAALRRTRCPTSCPAFAPGRTPLAMPCHAVPKSKPRRKSPSRRLPRNYSHHLHQEEERRRGWEATRRRGPQPPRHNPPNAPPWRVDQQPRDASWCRDRPAREQKQYCSDGRFILWAENICRDVFHARCVLCGNFGRHERVAWRGCRVCLRKPA